MRVLLISNLFPPGFVGGYELFAEDVADALHARGHDVAVLTSSAIDPDMPEPAPYRVMRTLERCIATATAYSPEEWTVASCFGTPRNRAALADAVAGFRPQNVMLFSISGIGALGIYRSLHEAGLRPVTLFGDNFFAGVRNAGPLYEAHADRGAMGRILAGTCGFFLSRRVRAEIELELGVRFDAPRYLPGLVHPELAGNPGRRHAESGTETRFVFASGLWEHKGIRILLDAVALARGDGMEPFSVDLHGPGQVEDWMEEVGRRGLGDVIRYRGVVAKRDMLGRYAEYDALLLPTWEREPFGLVAAEAAAAGCIPIMTGAIGAAEWMVDGLDCIKIRRTAPELVTAMKAVAGRRPPARRVALARAARRMFAFERWFPRIEQALEGAHA